MFRSSERYGPSRTTRKNWIKYTADSITLSAGTSANGVADLRTANDGNVYALAEAAATPGQLLIIDFVSVASFAWVRFLAGYDGTTTHAMEIQLYNWDTTAWDHSQSIQTGHTESGTIFGDHNFLVPDEESYVGEGANLGQVRVRLDHPMAGNASHNTYINEVALYGIYW